MMDYQFAGFVLGVTSLTVNTLLFFYVRRSERIQAKDKDLADFRADVDVRLDGQKERILKLETNSHPASRINADASLAEHSARLLVVEQAIKTLPTPEDVGRLYDRMNALEHRLGDRIDSVNSAVKRIEGENAAQTRILNLVYESLVK